MLPVGAGSTHTRLEHAAGPARACRSMASRCRAQGPEILGFELEDTEHVVQANDLCVLPVLLGSEGALRTFPGELLDTRRQISADGFERRFELFEGLLF